jgi:Cd2+/Zn2+-exporting ATPase
MKNKNIFNRDSFIFIALFLALIFYFTNFLSKNFTDYFLIIVGILATLPVIFNALLSLKNKKVNVDLLGGIALVASMWAREWSSVVFINLMIISSRILDNYTENNTRNAIEKLLKLHPKKIKIRRLDKIVEEDVSKIKLGDVVVVELGERVPVDGIIEDGEASVDQSSLTGESEPVAKFKGDKVLSSVLVVSGALEVRAEKIGKDTTLEKIIDLVKNSQKGKAQISTIADKFATWYILITLLAVVLLYFIFKDTSLILSLLLVACADDVAVAVPLSFLVSIGRLARRGIIVKGGDFLEGLTKVKLVWVDKTGTLTKGKLKVYKIEPWNGYKEEDVVRLAVEAEFFSEHPAAKAIINYANKNKINFEKLLRFKEFPGGGSIACYRDKKIVVGKQTFLEENGIKFSAEDLAKIDKTKDNGLNVTLVGFDLKPVGFIALADEVRPDAKETIQTLKDLGVEKWIMLTGDNEKVAQRVSSEVGLDGFYANLLPEDKLNFIKKSINNKYKVAMVGDGVNDAAALSLADIGVAMGAIGSDAAIEAADIALMKDDFSKIIEAIKTGQETMRVVRQNFLIWAIVNVTGLILVFSHILTPESASAYNFITDFFPLINSMRLFNFRVDFVRKNGFFTKFFL